LAGPLPGGGVLVEELLRVKDMDAGVGDAVTLAAGGGVELGLDVRDERLAASGLFC